MKNISSLPESDFYAKIHGTQREKKIIIENRKFIRFSALHTL